MYGLKVVKSYDPSRLGLAIVPLCHGTGALGYLTITTHLAC